mmetsp:Transcript_17041/g.20272  ORF Transcript_17041/g.20272 Transcript_17041/m.20272 type:complete len:88 (-) Transcript_17041:48-311(-)
MMQLNRRSPNYQFSSHLFSSTFTTNSTTNNNNCESERLSSNLAPFLSDPTLRKGITIGSFDLTSYSSTIESEAVSSSSKSSPSQADL